jgi:hypothetical protein
MSPLEHILSHHRQLYYCVMWHADTLSASSLCNGMEVYAPQLFHHIQDNELIGKDARPQDIIFIEVGKHEGQNYAQSVEMTFHWFGKGIQYGASRPEWHNLRANPFFLLTGTRLSDIPAAF